VIPRQPIDEESEGPPPGVDSTGIELFVDEGQGTAIFVGYFETEQKMRDASAVFEQMDPSEDPRHAGLLCPLRGRGTTHHVLRAPAP
jgi:hypothetical protein